MVIIWTTPAVTDLENYKNNTKKTNFKISKKPSRICR